MADEKETIDDVEISRKGIDMMVNNDWDGCEKLFAKHKDHSPLTNYCYCFMSYMKAVLTFEDQLLDKAVKDVEATEKLCSDQSTKVLSSLRKAFGMSSSSSSNSLAKGKKYAASDAGGLTPGELMEEKFTKAIVLADCKLYLAILTFIRQDVTAYLSSGLLQIRKSWKMYAKIQKQLYEIYKKMEPNAEQIYGSDPNSPSLIQLWSEENDEEEAKQQQQAANGGNANIGDEINNNNNASNQDALANNLLNELAITDEEMTGEGAMSLETVKRLLGAVSFGYGLFQICLSFTPPNILKLIKVFGFEGDRNAALKAINFTSNSKDMRAPFADMVLLWYSTIAIPLFGTSDADISISNDDTKFILERNLTKYPQSSLFLYMKGKYHRSILRDLAGSMESYEKAANYSSHIKEIQIISVYEMGWLHMQQLNYTKALEHFEILHKGSKWSKSFGTYICAILHGANGNFSLANQYSKEAIKILTAQTKKTNPIESFALKRNEYIKKNPIKTKAFAEMLVCELLYLWVCYPFMEESYLKKALGILDQMTEKTFMPLKCLYEGSVNMALKNTEFGEQCFNEAIARAENEKAPPFGKYVLTCANYELGHYHTELKNYADAKAYVAKAQSYKDFELENRINSQVRSLQRKVKHLSEGAKTEATLRARAEAEREAELKKEASIKNFYVE